MLTREARSKVRDFLRNAQDDERFDRKYGLSKPRETVVRPEASVISALDEHIHGFVAAPSIETFGAIYTARNTLSWISEAGFARLTSSNAFPAAITSFIDEGGDKLVNTMEIVCASLVKGSPFVLIYTNMGLLGCVRKKFFVSDLTNHEMCALLQCTISMYRIGDDRMNPMLSDRGIVDALIGCVSDRGEDAMIFELGLVALQEVIREHRENIMQVQTFVLGFVFRDRSNWLPADRSERVFRLFATVIEALDMGAGCYDSKRRKQCLVEWLRESRGSLRRSVLNVIAQMTGGRSALMLIEYGILDVLVEIVKEGSDLDMVMTILGNIASVSPEDCEKLCEMGFCAVIGECLGRGSLDVMIAAVITAANILWKGSFAEIRQVIETPDVINHMFEVLEVSDIADDKRVIVEGFASGIDAERESGSNTLAETLGLPERVASLFQLAQSDDVDLAEAVQLLLRKLSRQ